MWLLKLKLTSKCYINILFLWFCAGPFCRGSNPNFYLMDFLISASLCTLCVEILNKGNWLLLVSQLKPMTVHGCIYTSLLVCILQLIVVLYHTAHNVILYIYTVYVYNHTFSCTIQINTVLYWKRRENKQSKNNFCCELRHLLCFYTIQASVLKE